MTPGKLLRTLRFDQSDAQVFALAAETGEWAVSGSFAFVPLAPSALTGKTRQAFANGWLGLSSFGRATFVAVAAIEPGAYDQAVDRLAQHLIEEFGAPDRDVAVAAARDELAFSAEIAADKPVNTVFAVQRSIQEDGEIHEAVRLVDPPQGQIHSRIWDIVDDDA